jgi:L-asparagine oxygenase
MASKSVIQINLSNTEKNKLKTELNNFIYDGYGKNQYINELRRAIYKALPKHLLDLINQQKTSYNLFSGIVIDNLPIDEDIIGSPNFEQTGKDFKSGVLSENIITAFSTLIGEPYSIYYEGRELVNNLTPQTNTKYDYTGLGSEVELDFHVENAALQYLSEDDYSPLGVFFLGLRIDETVEQPKTYIADARKALQLLKQSDIEILYGNNFHLHLPHRWRETFNSSHINTSQCPVIRGSLHLPRVSVAFYPGMVTPIDNQAKSALNNFHAAIKEVSESIIITPGKLVYVDNRFTLHSRTRFEPTYDATGCPYRWVQRVFVSSSLWPFRNFQSLGDRVFVPKLENKIINVSRKMFQAA